MARGKNHRESAKLVDREKRYTLADAVALLRKGAYAKFDESVEAHVRLGVDPRNAEEQVRGTVALPHGTGKTIRVLAFAQGEAAQAAEDAGADHVGGAELVERIQGGWLEFDAAVAAPDMMREVGKVGRVLGPRGLMPNPKTGTVTADVGQAVAALKSGQVEYRVDRTGIVHAALGKMSFTDEQIVENLSTYLDALLKAKPAALKGIYVRSIAITTTMGPGIKVAYGAAA